MLAKLLAWLAALKLGKEKLQKGAAYSEGNRNKYRY